MRVRSTHPISVDRPRTSRLRVGVVALALAGAALGAPASAVAGPGPLVGPSSVVVPGAAGLGERLKTTSATVKKANCGAMTRKAKRAKGDQRKWLLRLARKCPADNKRLTQALQAIGDGRYVGTRGDGQQVDWTICANGTYKLLNTSDSGTGISEGSRWRIAWSQANGANGFTAIVEDPRPGGGKLSIGLSLRGGQWGVGIASFDSEVNKIGAVERTDAKADCAAL